MDKYKIYKNSIMLKIKNRITIINLFKTIEERNIVVEQVLSTYSSELEEKPARCVTLQL